MTITLPFLLGQKNVVSLSPTFDFDGDGLSEFLALEKQNFNDSAPSSAVFYEIDDFGSHMELWRYTTVNNIITTEIGDIDGNSVPEIILLSRASYIGSGSNDPYWLKAFSWTDIDFSPEPFLSINSTSGNARIRPSSFSLINSGIRRGNEKIREKDKIVFAQGSPIRSISINSLSESGAFDKIKSLADGNISIGYGPIHLTKFDHNSDSSLDIIALSPEEFNLRFQVFSNEEKGFSSDFSAIVAYPLGVRAPVGLIGSGIINADIDQDGLEELVLPFESGVVLALNQKGSDYSLSLIDSDEANLFSFSIPLTESDINNILLSRAELGIISGPLENLKLNEVPVTAGEFLPQINPIEMLQDDLSYQSNDEISELISPEPLATMRLSAFPVAANSQVQVPPESSQAANGLSGRLQQVKISSVDTQVGVAPSPQSITNRAGRMKQIALSNLGSGPGSPILTSDTAYVGQQFLYPVIPSKGTLAQFRKIILPDGAYYNSSTKNIVWTPSEEQIGLQRFEFQILVQGGGNRPVVEEVKGQGVTVRSTTQAELVVFTVAVVK